MRDKRHVKKGTSRHASDDKLNNPLTDEIERPVAPLHLDYETRKFFDRIVAGLPADYFLDADLGLLEAYCKTYVDYNRYTKEIDTIGAVYEDDRGILRPIPQCALQEKCRNSLITMSGKLQFNVKSRSGQGKSPDRRKLEEREAREKTGRRDGLLYSIPGGKKD